MTTLEEKMDKLIFNLFYIGRNNFSGVEFLMKRARAITDNFVEQIRADERKKVKSSLLKEMPKRKHKIKFPHETYKNLRDALIFEGFTSCRSQVLEAIEKVLGGKE